MTDVSTIWHREHEVVMAILVDVDAGHLCAGRGKQCRKPLVVAKAAWDHRISSGPHYDGTPWKLGEDQFTVTRHADGTPSDWTDTQCLALSRCPKCQHYDVNVITQEAYGDRITCTTPGCDRDEYHSIGD